MANSSTEDTFSLTFLASLIPKPFSGNRSELNYFILDCISAFNLAKPNQITPLLCTVLSKIEDPAKTQLTNFTFENWDELKTKLKSLYQDKERYAQLFEELNNLKQFQKETMSQYYRRIELAQTNVLKEISLIETDEAMLSGSIKNIAQITLSRFIYHSQPSRYRNS